MKKTMMILFVLSVTAIFALDWSGIKREMIARKNVNDFGQSNSKMPYNGADGGTFDQSMNGYGWILSTSRKIQTNIDPTTGTMVGGIYRQLNNESGSGTIGGMTGIYEDAFSGYAQTLYAESQFQGGAAGDPGGRYPYSAEFINGYFFGNFNDMDLVEGSGDVSQPMFTVADATYGWDLAFWSTPKRVEATEGGAVVPAAWTGNGDVVYDPDTGYYYWTQLWNETLANLEGTILDVVVGRTQTPADPDSWVWSDYSNLRFDCTDQENGVINIGDAYVAYCKDTNGNGTGKGIILANTNDIDDYAENSAGEMVLQNAKISYMYTDNWGGDDAAGDWTPNWNHADGNMFFQLESKDIIDWYGDPIYVDRDSIGYDEVNEEIIWDTVDVAYADDPAIQMNITAVATENNNVHLLFKVWPGTLDAVGSYYTWMDDGFRGGLYSLRGSFTESGEIEWGKANLVANWVDNDTEYDYIYYNNNNMSIGYAGTVNDHEVIYASWLDKPTSRAVASPFADLAGSSLFYQDVFFSASCDGGNYWEFDKEVDVESGDPDNPIWKLYYGMNITNTSQLQEQGWAVASNGTVDGDGNLTVYGGHQYWDPNTLTVPEDDDFACYLQYLRTWKITGSLDFVGIEAEEISLKKDFDLHQNYPNPFNPSTEIKFNLANSADVKLTVFNARGQAVMNLKDEKMSKGLHTVNFDAGSLNSGVYFYKLEANGRSETKKMVLMK